MQRLASGSLQYNGSSNAVFFVETIWAPCFHYQLPVFTGAHSIS